MQKKRFVAVLVLNIENNVSKSPSQATLISVSKALSTSLHCEASNSGLSTFSTLSVLDNYPPTHGRVARMSRPGWLVK